MSKYSIILFLLLLLTLPFSAKSQTATPIIDSTYQRQSIPEFIKRIKSDFNIKIFYNPDDIPPTAMISVIPGESLISILRINLAPMDLFPFCDHQNNIFISSKKNLIPIIEKRGDVTDTNSRELSVREIQTMRSYSALKFEVGSKEQYNGDKALLTGYITKEEDSEPVIGGTIQIEETNEVTTTDRDGIFRIDLEPGRYTLIANSIECEPRKAGVIIHSDGEISFTLPARMVLLDEVVIRSDQYHNVRSTKMGFEKLSVKSIREIPVVLGEKDIIKVAMLLPGVQSSGEGASGFNVRGSPADQNLFYLSNIPVYNTSHLFGFFSAFNSEAISEFSLYKSVIPSQYGGRLASVFDITTHQGRNDKFKLTGGISPVSGQFMAEGPIKKSKSSYMLSARSTYSDWLLNMIKDPELQMSDAAFNDVMANITTHLNHNNELQLVGYYSHDRAIIASVTDHKYTNNGASIKWTHRFTGLHKVDISLATGSYYFIEKNSELDIAAYKQDYNFRHSEARVLFSWHPFDNHTFTYGLNSILYQVSRGDLLPLNDQSLVQPNTFAPEKGLESGLFVNENWEINKYLAVDAGFRVNFYHVLGPGEVYSYFENMPRELSTIKDTLQYRKNEIIKQYAAPDYRLGIKIQPVKNISIKAGYNRLHQYLFLMSNTIAIAPTAMWKLCDYNIRPMTGDQYSLGVYTNLFQNTLEFSIETYYKTAKNIVEYEDGASFYNNSVPETELIQGKLESKGMEVMIKKLSGKLSGWINYTYSKATIDGNDPYTGEFINFGNPYPANYDKPHALNLVLNYKPNRRIRISGNIVYNTGRPITLPTSVYYINEQPILNYSNRNEYRLPDYFRADMSITVEGNLLSKKLAHGTFILSVYNLTGRKNAYSVYYKSIEGKIKGYKLSVFGAPIPSLTYNFKLGNYAN